MTNNRVMDTRTAGEGLPIATVGIVAGLALTSVAAMLLAQEARRCAPRPR